MTDFSKPFSSGAEIDLSAYPPINAPAEEIKRFFRSFQYNDLPDCATRLDELLYGADCSVFERMLYSTDLRRRYPGELPWNRATEYVWTSYSKIRDIMKKVNPAGKTVYDLGAGYFRFPLYGAMVEPTANFAGIELVTERALAAERARIRLELGNVAIKAENARSADFSDGDIFYLWCPFSPDTFHIVVDKLQQIAENRQSVGKGPITIATRGSEYFKDQPWLRPLAPVQDSLNVVDYFESVEV